MTQPTSASGTTTTPVTTPLTELARVGVSVWLDDLSRDLVRSGDLARLIEQGVLGETSNPTIFASALAKGNAYDEQMIDLAARGADVEQAVFEVTTTDVREACDVFRPVWDRTAGLDGVVSLEVEPRLAHDTQGTVDSARTLWQAVDRPNLMIKIPATEAGLPAITQVLADGISVNVTLIFGLERYRAVVEAWLAGVEQAVAAGRDVTRLGSVASFFVSRVDALVDKRLDALGTPEAAALRGRAAVANARLAYQVYADTIAGERWAALSAAGARPQRPLWASTGVKDPAYPDTKYVVDLVAPETVNTMPMATLSAVLDHADLQGDTVRGTYQRSRELLDAVAALGIGYDEVIEQLEREGVDKFMGSWDELLETVRGELDRLGGGRA